MIVPIELGRNLFRLQVFSLEPVGGLEFGDRLLDPTKAPQLMAVHVTRVRDERRHAGIRGTMDERLFGPAAVLEGVRQIVLSGEMIRRELQRTSVKGLGACGAPLPA